MDSLSALMVSECPPSAHTWNKAEKNSFAFDKSHQKLLEWFCIMQMHISEWQIIIVWRPHRVDIFPGDTSHFRSFLSSDSSLCVCANVPNDARGLLRAFFFLEFFSSRWSRSSRVFVSHPMLARVRSFHFYFFSLFFAGRSASTWFDLFRSLWFAYNAMKTSFFSFSVLSAMKFFQRWNLCGRLLICWHIHFHKFHIQWPNRGIREIKEANKS